MKDVCLSLSLMVVVVMASIFSSASAFSSLGKKSTARDVLYELNSGNRLASFVQKDDATAVVTGGNSGIGSETVKTLALTGMKVVLCARNEESAQKTLEKIPDWCRDNVSVQKLDLADMDSIQRAAQEIQETHTSIDLLCNNAGVMALPQRQETKNGIEMQVGVNHVGHHMLTRLLLPHLNENGRIVNVASSAHQMSKGDRDWNSEQSYSAWGTYGTSKLANVLFAKSLQEKLNEAGRSDISSVSLHPGVIKTNLWRNTPSLLQFATNLFADKSIEQGAATNVYCSLVDKLEGGEYYQDCQVTSTYPTAQGKSIRQDLWTYTENLIKEKGYDLPTSLLRETETAVELV